jgi:hypothetical protein
MNGTRVFGVSTRAAQANGGTRCRLVPQAVRFPVVVGKLARIHVSTFDIDAYRQLRTREV